ncbi:MAG: ROK family protein [Pseudomonadota bacterium]
MTALRFGIDLGGTKIEAVALDGAASLQGRHRVATPDASYEDTIDAIADALTEVAHQAGATPGRVGLCMPGALSPITGLICNAHATCLNGHALDHDLETRLGIPTRLENDANCFALAETQAGAAQGAEIVAGLIIGTGIGAGLIAHGRVLAGRNRIAGEWGHNPLPNPRLDEVPGPQCKCGRYGCIEAWCAGPGLAADHARETGMFVEPAEIAMAAAAGDAAAIDTLDRHAGRLGRAMAGLVNILDPDIIVLGGGLSNLPGLADRLATAMRPHIYSDSVLTEIRLNALGDSAGVIGAAWLWPEEETR